MKKILVKKCLECPYRSDDNLECEKGSAVHFFGSVWLLP
jgi:hypothetical protein